MLGYANHKIYSGEQAMQQTEDLQIRKNEEKSRFELSVGGEIAFVNYVEMGKKIIYTHTEVPEAFKGQGMGARLARGVLDYARAQGLQVMPLCPFIAAWIRRHTEYADLVIEGFVM